MGYNGIYPLVMTNSLRTWTWPIEIIEIVDLPMKIAWWFSILVVQFHHLEKWCSSSMGRMTSHKLENKVSCSRPPTRVYGGFLKRWYQKNGLLILENRMKMDDLGVPLFFWKPPYGSVWKLGISYPNGNLVNGVMINHWNSDKLTFPF